MTVANLPFAVLRAADESVRELVRLGRRARAGEWDPAAIDRICAGLYGLDTSELEVLRRFVDDELGFVRV